MKNLKIQWHIGNHSLSLLDGKDLISVSGGVPLDIPLIVEAKKREIPLTNDSQIFLTEVPCPVIAITGSSGKTTVTALLGEIAKKAIKPPDKVWIGGNIGNPLIENIDQIKAQDTVILELSSFQLELMDKSPHIAAITNITPNHLDRHGTLEAYTAAKNRIAAFQTKMDLTILNREDPGSWSVNTITKGQIISFGKERLSNEANGTYVKDNQIYLQRNNQQFAICPLDNIQLRGEHNLLNVLCACALAEGAGFPITAMSEAIKTFKGVAHRLEFVREYQGSNWYNDSIATAPERTIAAINSFSEPIVLLLGGKDKNLPWEKLAQLIRQRVDHVIVFGDAAEKILKAIGVPDKGNRPYSITHCLDLYQAVQTASQVSAPGDVILLSPGGTSYDAFKDFEERGERFRLWVHQLP
jgi:UDP-N-acetylmuramoylalanine--D-glutamate ligase